MNLKQMAAQRAASLAAAEAEVADLESAQRALLATAGDNLTTEQQARFDELTERKRVARANVTSLRASVDELNALEAEESSVAAKQNQRTPGATPPARRDTERQSGWVIRENGRPATVARDASFTDHEVVSEYAARHSAREQAVVGQHGSFDQMVRALTTTSGSALVPTQWAGELIDKARAKAAVLQAGAEVVPMGAKVVNVGRLTADPTAAWRSEGSTITASDPTFDNVTLTAKSLNSLTVLSNEYLQDADDVENAIQDAVAAAMANAIDLAALYGGVDMSTKGGSDLSAATVPDGILSALLADASSSVLGDATNGTAQTAASFYDEVIDTIGQVEDYNESPNALLWNSKLRRHYQKAYASDYQPLQAPSAVSSLTHFVTNQIPSYTQGTMSDVATDLFVGDFSKLLLGVRLDVSVQVLTERYAELGQTAIVTSFRGDVALARPRAFSVYRALEGE